MNLFFFYPTTRFKLPQIIERCQVRSKHVIYFFNRFTFPNTLHLKNLKELQLSFSPKKLEKLKNCFHSDNISDDICKQIGISFPFLSSSLDLAFKISILGVEYSSKLKKIKKFCFLIGNLPDVKFQLLSLNFPKLKSLNCSDFAEVTDENIKHLAKLTSLESLLINTGFIYHRITSKSILILANTLKNLQKLDFDNLDVINHLGENPLFVKFCRKQFKK